jgi:hypothetical protein
MKCANTKAKAKPDSAETVEDVLAGRHVSAVDYAIANAWSQDRDKRKLHPPSGRKPSLGEYDGEK